MIFDFYKCLLKAVISIYCVNLTQCLEAPAVRIPNQGIVVGTYLKMFRTQNIKAYLGIPYAESKRFSPPNLDAVKWNGILNATSYGPDCWQSSKRLLQKDTKFVLDLLADKQKSGVSNFYDESCLHLNIFIPDGLPGKNGYAVVIWFHSGDFSYGSSSDMNPFQLVFKQKIIVVSVSYRLNIFGFLTTGDGEAQGNYGLMDQSAALFWIRKNINHFGGDENKITIMGHSAGAISVGLHLTSGEWSKDSFQKAIIMSGNILMDNAVRSPKDYDKTLDMVANTFGCIRRPSSLLVQCLKRVDAKIITENLPSIEWGPVIDFGLSNNSYPFIIDNPNTLFRKGFFQKVPTLLGITNVEDILSFLGNDTSSQKDFDTVVEEFASNDLKKAISQDEDEVCSNVNLITDAIQYVYQSSKNESTSKTQIRFINDRLYIAPLYLLSNLLSESEKLFVYIFDYKPKTKFYTLPEWIGVPKYFDQIFIWGLPYMENYDLVREWNSTDKKMSDLVMTMWANFVKTSNPTISNVYIKWNTYKPQDQTVLMINETFQLNVEENRHVVHFWNTFYPKLMEATASCCNLSLLSKSTSIYIVNISEILTIFIINIFIVFINNY